MEEEQRTLEFLSAAMTECLKNSLPGLSRALSESFCGFLSDMEVNEKRGIATAKGSEKAKTDSLELGVRNSKLTCQYCGAVLMPGINCTLRVIPTRRLKVSARRWNLVYRDFHGIANSQYNQRIRNIVNTSKGFDYFLSRGKEKKMKNVLKLRCLVCKRMSLFFGAEKAAKFKKEVFVPPVRKPVEEKPVIKAVKKTPVTKAQTKGVTQKKAPEKGAKGKKANDGGLNHFLSGLKF